MEVVILEVAISEVTSAEVTTAGSADTMAGITVFMVDFIRPPTMAAIIHTRMPPIVSFADAPFGPLTVTESGGSASACKRGSRAARINCSRAPRAISQL